jgi:hypothetical protein
MDATRLARAIHLSVSRMGPGHYVVTGGAAEHTVRAVAGALVCDCTDAAMHGGAECKHVLAVRLRRGDPEALTALRELVSVPKRPRGRKLSTAGARGGLTP